MKDALQADTPTLEAIEQRYLAPDAPVQLLKDEVKKTLRASRLMTREKKNSWRMGVHPDNRYGDGVVPSDVIGLISDIFGQGASKSALQDPTACTATARHKSAALPAAPSAPPAASVPPLAG